MHRSRNRRLGALLLTSTLLGAAPALAQSTGANQHRWEFAITPYLWGAGLDGDVKVGRLPSLGVEASFTDLVDFLDLGLMAAFEGRKGRGGFFVDGMYIKLSDTTPAPNPSFGDVDTELIEQLYTFAGTYRAVEGKAAVDLFFGTRYLDLGAEMGLSGGTASGRQVEGDENWWDGFVGVRVRYQPGAHWIAVGYLDVGAGGSDLSWQALVGGGYAFKKVVSLDFGYRYLSEDYENDDFVYDMAMGGGYLGVGFRF